VTQIVRKRVMAPGYEDTRAVPFQSTDSLERHRKRERENSEDGSGSA